MLDYIIDTKGVYKLIKVEHRYSKDHDVTKSKS